MKQKILTYLTERQGYVSGQDISNDLGVSRTAIWKYINALREEGYEIESMTRKGYRLIKCPDILSEDEIGRHLPEGILPGGIYVFDEIDSTNEEAKRSYTFCKDRALYVSDYQTAGKGRRGRSWLSPKGRDVFFSYLLKPEELPPESASMITLIAALAGVKALSKLSDVECLIKWPNDIVINGHKICGILTEMGADMDSVHYIVPGIGFNLNRTEFDASIGSTASSFYLETGHLVDRSAFVADYTVEFMKRYDLFLKELNLASFVEEYNNHLINIGREVKLIRREGEVVRQALGINELGELLVKDDEGKIEAIFSGEVSVRGLYGYV